MKKLLLSALPILAFGATNVDAQVNKTPLIEHFTQASCGPCASQNPIMYSTLNTFGSGNYVKVTYQVSWPGVDPMNAEFPTGPNARRGFYNVSGVPDCSLNGGTTASPNTAVTAATLAAKAAETTPYSMTVSQSWLNGDITVTIDVTNTTGSTVSTMNKIYVAMVEEQISFTNSPGSNGETEFYYVNREFYNPNTGAAGAISGVYLSPIAGGATTSFSFVVTSANIPSYIRDLNQLSFVAFVQSLSSKDIEQAAKSVAGIGTNTDEVTKIASTVEIMPNPVNNKMVVNFTATSDNANIVIRNIQGQTVKELANHTVIGENSVAINTTELPAGIYTLTIVSDVDATTKRFVVSK